SSPAGPKLAARSPECADVRRASGQDDDHADGNSDQCHRGGARDLQELAQIHAAGLRRNAGSARTISGEGENMKTGTEPAPQELVVTRILDAPREVVFKTWTDPERLKRWWGPKAFTNPS